MNQPHWVLLRGLGREARHWGDFPDRLKLATNNLVTAIDLPGVGEFVKYPPPATIKEIAAFVQFRLPENRPIILVAVSLGAMVAQQLILQNAEFYQKAFLINTSAKNAGSTLERMRWMGLVGLTQAILKLKPRQREAQILATVANSGALRNKMLPLWTTLAEERKVPPRAVIHQLLAASQFKAPDLRPFKEKIVLIQSLGDRLVDPACSNALQRMWGCELLSHPWAGHDLAIDDPDWLIERLLSSI